MCEILYGVARLCRPKFRLKGLVTKEGVRPETQVLNDYKRPKSVHV